MAIRYADPTNQPNRGFKVWGVSGQVEVDRKKKPTEQTANLQHIVSSTSDTCL